MMRERVIYMLVREEGSRYVLFQLWIGRICPRVDGLDEGSRSNMCCFDVPRVAGWQRKIVAEVVDSDSMKARVISLSISLRESGEVEQGAREGASHVVGGTWRLGRLFAWDR